MEQHVDLRLVKSVILAVSFCAVCYWGAWLLFVLLQEYINVFVIAFVTSLAIHPLKEWIQYYFIIAYTSPSKFPFLPCTLFMNLPLIFNPKYGVLVFAIISFIVYKSSISFSLFFIVSLLLLDLIVKSTLGFMIKCTSTINIISKKQFFDTLLTIFLIVFLIVIAAVLQTFVFGSIALELTHQGKSLFNFFSSIVDEDPWESFKLSPYSKVLDENLGEIWRNFTHVPTESSAEYERYIDSGKELPVIGGIIAKTSKFLDFYLKDVGLSSGEVIFLLDLSNKPDLLWKGLGYCIKVLVGNLGGVAFGISNVLEKVILYFTLVYILVKDAGMLIEKAIGVIPLSQQMQTEISTDIKRTISGITISFILAASIHYIVTLATFSLLELEFKFLFSGLAASVGLFPYVGAWVVTLPMVIYLSVSGSLKGLVLLFVEYFAINYLDGQVYTSQLGYFNQSMIGIVIVLGIYKFGFLGIFYGPLIMSLGYLIFKIGHTLNQQPLNS